MPNGESIATPRLRQAAIITIAGGMMNLGVPFAEFRILPNLFVADSAAQTAQNLAAHHGLFLVAIFAYYLNFFRGHRARVGAVSIVATGERIDLDVRRLGARRLRGARPRGAPESRDGEPADHQGLRSDRARPGAARRAGVRRGRGVSIAVFLHHDPVRRVSRAARVALLAVDVPPALARDRPRPRRPWV